MCKIMCHTQQLWKKNIVWIERVSSMWAPLQHSHLHHPAVRRLLDSESLLILFLFLCLPLQANLSRCRKVTAYRWIQTPEELQPVSCWSHAYVLQYGWKVTNTDIYSVNDTNLKMFCLQLQALGLVRSSRPSCRTWWLRGACSPSERSSERVGASHL